MCETSRCAQYGAMSLPHALTLARWPATALGAIALALMLLPSVRRGKEEAMEAGD